MKILHITTEIPIPELLSGGMGVHVWNVATEQAKLGHEVTVCCPLRTDEEHNGVRFTPWAQRLPKFQTEMAFKLETYLETICKLFTAPRPDIIHCHEWDAAPVANRLALFTGVPCVSTLHISNILNQQYMTPHHYELEHYHLWWEQEMMRRSDAMIAISRHYAEFIKMFNRGKPVRVIPNGFDITAFQNGVVREKPDRRALIFFHGRLCGQKGIDLIIEAAKQRKDIYWVLAGPIAAKEDGTCLEDHLLKDLRLLEQQGKVLLTGKIPQTEIGAWLRACDVAVYPHYLAPFDCAVLEAMACGAAVVTTGVDAIGEYTTPMQDCVYMEPTAESLLKSIRLAMDYPSIKQRAAQRVAGMTWEKTTKETLNYYKEIINANKDNTEHHAAA